MWRFSTVRVVLAVLLGFSLWVHPGAADASKLILALGDASYISPASAKAWTGAEVERVLGEHELEEFAVVILSNVPYSGLPGPVREDNHRDSSS